MTTVEINPQTLLLISRNDSTKIITSNYIVNNSFTFDPYNSTADDKPLVGKSSPVSFRRFSKLIRTIFTTISIPIVIIPNFRWRSLPSQLSLPPSPCRKVTGTLFGNRRGQVSFAVQHDTRSPPVLIIKLAVSTAALVKEMSSGLVRIALECKKLRPPARLDARGRGGGGGGGGKLFKEPVWTMYCNGRKCGVACSKTCTESDWSVLSMVRSVSAGAGVIPVVVDDGGSGGGVAEEGELVYMRAKFERVVGGRDSEAYYMINPDGNGGPELSIFMLRI